MNWLITGGCGFIGRNLIQKLLASGGANLRVLDNFSVGSFSDIAGLSEDAELQTDARLSWSDKLSVIAGDICNLELVKQVVLEADVVVHLAANTGVEPSVEDPFLDCQQNVLGTLNVLEAARDADARVVFASSGAPLGVQTPPLHERLDPHPASPYGASKLAGEGYCSAYFHAFGVETVALRFGNVYGRLSGHKASVVAKFIKKALADEPIEIYGDGAQTRDFIFVDDLVEAIISAVRTPNVGGEIFQIASMSEVTVNELVKELFVVLEHADVNCPEIAFGASRVGDVERNYSDITKARTLLGWEPKTSLRDGLSHTLNWFMEQEELRK